MQMNYLMYASDFPFKNFCKLAKQTETTRNYQKQGLVMIKHCLGNSQINSIPEKRVLSHNFSSQNKGKSSRVQLARIWCLRTVPTKYKGFCASLGLRGKSRSLPGLLESTKKNGGSHAFFRDN